jgi:glycosyltransferase involved in cell wall biosynthesis
MDIVSGLHFSGFVMIKVLHVLGQMARGGTEMRTVELMPLMARKGVQFDYCTLVEGEGALDKMVRELGGNIYCCRLGEKDLCGFAKRFIPFLRRSDYDIVHTHLHYFSGYVVYCAYKGGKKSRIVHFRSTGDGREPTQERRRYAKVMLKVMDKYATAILAVCKGAMDQAWRTDWQKDSRCRVVYDALDLSGYEYSGTERESLLNELGISLDSKLIIHVGHFAPVKAHDILIDAAAKVLKHQQNSHFLLVGTGELFQPIQAKVRNMGIDRNVHFMGLRDDVPRLLKASDCLVLSSRYEGLPGVVLEAIAAQLPVVATDLPGVREISEHTDIMTIVPVEDSNAICNTVLKVLVDHTVRPHTKVNFPRQFDLEYCANNLYEVYTNQMNQLIRK